MNVVDALSAMAVYLMGEADESTPLVLGRNIPHIEYTTVIGYETSVVPFEQDLFHPLLQGLQKSE